MALPAKRKRGDYSGMCGICFLRIGQRQVVGSSAADLLIIIDNLSEAVVAYFDYRSQG
jgi:hypothetical protein